MLSIALDIIYFWAPGTIAVLEIVWAIRLVVLEQTVASRVAAVLVVLVVFVTMSFSLWALILTRFFYAWASYVPYILIGFGLVLLAVSQSYVRRARR